MNEKNRERFDIEKTLKDRLDIVHYDNYNQRNIRYAQMIYTDCMQNEKNLCHVSGLLSQFCGITSRQAKKYVDIVRYGSTNIQDDVAECRLTVNDAAMIVRKTKNENEQEICASLLKNAAVNNVRATSLYIESSPINIILAQSAKEIEMQKMLETSIEHEKVKKDLEKCRKAVELILEYHKKGIVSDDAIKSIANLLAIDLQKG